MLSKRTRIFLITGLLFGVILLLALVFSGELASNNTFRIRMVMYLTELAKPRVIEHTEIVTQVEMISHPKPDLSIDDKILKDLNCPIDERGVRYCAEITDAGQSESLGCFSIMTPDPLLGGLLPAYPLAECVVGNGRYVYQSGRMIPMGIAYIIERQGVYERIDSLSRLKAIYAPIETDTEALSYALAATGYSELYGTEIYTELVYYVERLENTHVEVRGSEYVVRLYDYQWYGCGQHETIAVDVAVSFQGNIHEIYREDVYRDNYWSCGD
jgi:hypothetical protein